MDNSLTKEKLYLQMLKLHYKVGTVQCYYNSKANLHNDIKLKTVAIFQKLKKLSLIFKQHFKILTFIKFLSKFSRRWYWPLILDQIKLLIDQVQSTGG